VSVVEVNKASHEKRQDNKVLSTGNLMRGSDPEK
jgi:hypothetical protein